MGTACKADRVFSQPSVKLDVNCEIVNVKAETLLPFHTSFVHFFVLSKVEDDVEMLTHGHQVTHK